MKVNPCNTVPGDKLSLADIKKSEGVYTHPHWSSHYFITLCSDTGTFTTIVFSKCTLQLSPISPIFTTNNQFKKLDATVCFEIKENK